MKLNVVERYHSKAMTRMVQPLVDYLGAGFGDKSEPDAVNIHVPWHFILDEKDGRHAIVYTHCNLGDEKRLEEACAKAEIVFCMSFQGRKELLDLGVPIEKTWVAYPGSGEFLARRRNIGLFGYVQPNGRKREHILVDMAYLLDPATKSLLNFIATGANWKDAVEAAKAAGLHAMLATEVTGHAEDPDMNLLYQSMDAVLVSGFIEGGPLPLLEAYRVGCKVFAPNIGLAADLMPEETYIGAEGLAKQLTDWVKPMLDRMHLGHLFTWQSYAEEFAIALMPLTGEKYQDEWGLPRYRQLLDIVKQRKPRIICEVGTWNGQRALQMIQTAQHYNEDIRYIGFDVFEESTPGLVRREFSKEGCPVSVVEQRLKPSGANIWLHKGNSTKTMQTARHEADLYFIDGGHSYETIANDWAWVRRNMKKDSVVIFDDYCIDGPKDYGCKPIIDILDASFKVTVLPEVTKGRDGSVQMVMVTNA